MTFPVIATTDVSSNTAATTHNFSLPTGTSAGDILVMMPLAIGTGTGLPATITGPSNWTELASSNQRFYSATYDATQGTSFTTVGSATSRIQTLRITGGASIVGATSAGSSSQPNPPSLNPSWSAALDTLWLALASQGLPGTAQVPTNYTQSVITNFTVVIAYRIHSTYRELAADSEDPGTFDTTNTTSWQCATYAIEPAAAATGKRMTLLGAG